MKQVIRLTESDLKNIVEKSVRRAIKDGVLTEETLNEGLKDKAIELAKMAGVSVAIAASWLAALGLGAFDNDPLVKQNDQQIEINKSIEDPENGLGAGVLAPGRKTESRIRRAVMESIKKLMREGIG